tara:strand:+ start:2987 stop:3376 length:390 start_codon:yes stop_codon:yes gene_type:complete
MENWKEKDLFEYLQENYMADLVKAKNPMSRWDCYSPMYKKRVELKCRKKHYDTLLIEKKKYDAMIEESMKHADEPVYINSTPEGVFVFNLLDIEPEWETNFRNPSNTYWGGGRVAKEVAYLRLDDAIRI